MLLLAEWVCVLCFQKVILLGTYLILLRKKCKSNEINGLWNSNIIFTNAFHRYREKQTFCEWFFFQLERSSSKHNVWANAPLWAESSWSVTEYKSMQCVSYSFASPVSQCGSVINILQMKTLGSTELDYCRSSQPCSLPSVRFMT